MYGRILAQVQHLAINAIVISQLSFGARQDVRGRVGDNVPRRRAGQLRQCVQRKPGPACIQLENLEFSALRHALHHLGHRVPHDQIRR